MNAPLSPPTLRWLMLVLVTLALLLLASTPLVAGEVTAPRYTSGMLDMVSNRSRMIQVSLVCVIVGCSLLWWRR